MTSTARLLARRPRVVHDHNWLGGLAFAMAYFIAQGWVA